MQAGQYGAPQGRKRVLFWGAKRGLPLPEFPVPTHGFSQKSFYHSLPTGEKLPPPSRSLDPDNLHQYAALHPVTINDAIGDLVSLCRAQLGDIYLTTFFSAPVRLVCCFTTHVYKVSERSHIGSTLTLFVNPPQTTRQRRSPVTVMVSLRLTP